MSLARLRSGPLRAPGDLYWCRRVPLRMRRFPPSPPPTSSNFLIDRSSRLTRLDGSWGSTPKRPMSRFGGSWPDHLPHRLAWGAMWRMLPIPSPLLVWELPGSVQIGLLAVGGCCHDHGEAGWASGGAWGSSGRRGEWLPRQRCLPSRFQSLCRSGRHCWPSLRPDCWAT